MKFYDYKGAPSPRRVRMFVAEKGLNIETVTVDLAQGEQFDADFQSKNPRCTVPLLELDDGRCLWDTLAICSYLEAKHPEPPLMGRDPIEQAQVLQWYQRIETDGFQAIAESFRNHSKGFRDRSLTGPAKFDQIPALVERGRIRATLFLQELDHHFANHRFVVGDCFTLADINAYAVIGFANWIKLTFAEDQTHLRRWHREVSDRPSAGL